MTIGTLVCTPGAPFSSSSAVDGVLLRIAKPVTVLSDCANDVSTVRQAGLDGMFQTPAFCDESTARTRQ